MILTEFFSLVTEMSVSKKRLAGFVVPKKQADIVALQDWADTSSEFVLKSETLHIDVAVGFELTPILEGGLGYASYEDYFDRRREWWNNPSFDKIVEHQWRLSQASDTQISQESLQIIAKLLQLLTDKNRFYVTNNIVVFFSKKPSELALKAQDSQTFVQLIRNLSEPQIQSIDKLCVFLGGSTEEEHFYAKKNAFSTALTDYLTEKEGRIQHDICDLVADIVNITNQALTQYDLYLEDFSYSKFVKKIEESSSKFISRVNDALSRSVTQVLALPVATVVLKSMDDQKLSVLANVSLFVYCLICAFVLYNQSRILEHIEKEIKLFEDKLPRQLNDRLWKLNSETITNQIANQKRLSCLLWFTILACMAVLIFNILLIWGWIIVTHNPS
ncbi:Uncharacterised protein [Actinobacillus pleuropneumoniae]|uniref:hypothetical protein n=1 Tax=Actinobacillus pleuropneumoniae TaxID=715 RepID=UPI0002F87AEE|nr:hypothetical protein [Actinobacillus pleuropneumoniae]SQF64617.1 Uncharacterised protein [Actinobacillus pleuropneumoniae]